MQIAEDKKKHFIAGFTISVVVSLLFGYIIGFAVAFVAGLVKEGIDKEAGTGTPEIAEVGFTVLGAVAAIVAFVCVSWLFGLAT